MIDMCSYFNSLPSNHLGLPYQISLRFVSGEWWNADVEAVENQGNQLGLPPNMSDAHTINGKPGPLFPCSEKRM